jgi:hypothetical protein
MSNKLTAATNIALALLPAERAAIELAALSHRCIATLYDERRSGGFPLGAGQAQLDLVSEASHLADAACRKMIEAHIGLAQLPASLGITGWGPGECVPNASVTGLRAAA